MKKFKKLFQNKKFIIFLFILILFIGGLFFWFKDGKEIKGNPEDYEIVATEIGIFVENQKAGLVVKVPQGWEVEKMETGEGSVVLQTLDIEGEERNGITAPPLIKGCGIEISVIYERMDFEEIKEKTKMIHWGIQIQSEEFKEITINDHQALKNIFDSEVLGSAIVIYIPKENKLYDFALYFSEEEKERCIQEFDSFLETISINQ